MSAQHGTMCCDRVKHSRSTLRGSLLILMTLSCAKATPHSKRIALGPVKAPTADYAGVGFHASARWMLPRDGTSTLRVWAKGTPADVRVCVGKECMPLDAPFYTAVLEPPIQQSAWTDVAFVGAGGARTISLRPPGDGAAYYGPAKRDPSQDFSFLTYGCLQPFTTFEHGGVVYPALAGASEFCVSQPADQPTLACENYQVRRLLAEYSTLARSEAWEPRWGTEALGATTRGDPAYSPPALVLGTGDQVYMDAAYGTIVPTLRRKQKHPLSLWSSADEPELLVPVARLASRIDQQYRLFWSFETVESVHRRLPALLVWDDHEIMDGWGSQGIESRFRSEYWTFRRAFLAHQYAWPGGRAEMRARDDPRRSPRALPQTAVVHGVPVFALDTRSERGLPIEALSDSANCTEVREYSQNHEGDRPILSSDQACQFEEWLDKIPQGGWAVVVSSSPVFSQMAGRVSRLTSNSNSELQDDAGDSWASGDNWSQRELLVALMRNARVRGVRPVVVSGDIHRTVPIVVWDCESPPEDRCVQSDAANRACTVLAYEVIVTGLSNENYRAADRILESVESTRWGPNVTDRDRSGRVVDATLFEDRAVPNFGVLDFRKDGSASMNFIEVDGEQGTVQRRVLGLDFQRQRCDDVSSSGRGTMFNVASLPTFDLRPSWVTAAKSSH